MDDGPLDLPRDVVTVGRCIHSGESGRKYDCVSCLSGKTDFFLRNGDGNYRMNDCLGYSSTVSRSAVLEIIHTHRLDSDDRVRQEFSKIAHTLKEDTYTPYTREISSIDDDNWLWW